MCKKLTIIMMAAVLLGGCASMGAQAPASHSASVLNYLFGGDTEQAVMKPEMATLKLPLRVGLAFVPSGGPATGGISEADQAQMLGRVKEAFMAYPFVKEIVVVPNAYLTVGGGFENLGQVGRLFELDVVALLSYDQVQFSDATASSFLYWTLIGAYVVSGDQYDVHTSLEASVIDIPSRKLLFRAPGTSKVKGTGTMVNFSEKAREGRVVGFREAIDNLIPNLKAELEAFRVRVRETAGGSAVNIVRPPGYVDPPPVR